MMRVESTTEKIPVRHELMDVSDAKELSDLISEGLENLEARYADYCTANSLKSNIRSERK